ncbi:MAG: 3-oxoacyl-[acyl-carrier-protein] reductase [Eubacteriales bacterium]|nr:3-oxoacyl-[acyl-carrier-protein] reductase [Eubacteriales bacterium]
MQNGKTALVTGAGRGIGRAIAKRLAEAGYYVIINYNGSQEAAEAALSEIQEAGGAGETSRCDVSDYAACETMIKELAERLGSIDVLVNNAGITRDTLLMRMSEEDFDRVLSINLKGAFNCTKFVSKYMMKKRFGRIISISSVSGVMGNAGQANYAASKAGLIGLTKSVARELAGRNITANAIAPGFIDTDMTAVLGEKLKEGVTDAIPMKRFGKPEDVAALAAFLASEEANYITGQVIAVDGGMSM